METEVKMKKRARPGAMEEKILAMAHQLAALPP
jgi:hypothetical protein